MLALAMRRVQAWERLGDPHYVWGLSFAGYHALLLDAGFPADEAQQLANKYGWDRLTAGEAM